MSRDPLDLHPVIRPLFLELIVACNTEGIIVTPICTHRTLSEQRDLYMRGKSLTAVGFHNVMRENKPASLAFDLGLCKGTPRNVYWPKPQSIKYRDWCAIGEIGMGIGLTWGGMWNGLVDLGHFQLDDQGDLTISDIIDGTDPVTSA